jgi:hypothetical protein
VSALLEPATQPRPNVPRQAAQRVFDAGVKAGGPAAPERIGIELSKELRRSDEAGTYLHAIALALRGEPQSATADHPGPDEVQVLQLAQALRHAANSTEGDALIKALASSTDPLWTAVRQGLLDIRADHQQSGRHRLQHWTNGPPT